MWNPLADDSQIVQIGFHTIVWTSTYGNLKFVRKFYIVISLIEPLMDLFGQGKGIQQTILTGGSFAGNYRSYFRPGSSGFQAFRFQSVEEWLDVVIGKSLNFHGLTGSES